MAQPTLRETIAMLSDYTTFTTWLQQLKMKSTVLNIWNIIDPESTDLPMIKPSEPQPPEISEYQPNSAHVSANPEEAPSSLSHLSAAGVKSYKDDIDIYKIRIESFKLKNQCFREQKADLDKIVTFIQSTVSLQLQSTCCLPHESVKQ
jgi:hypothetical protein